MLPTIPIGPLRLQTYGLFLLLAFWAGMGLAGQRAERHGLQRDHVYNGAFYALLGGLITARLGHVIAFFDVYRADPRQIISLSPGALLPAAGLLGALLVLAGYLWRHRLSPLRFADAAAPGFLLAMAIAGIGAFLAGRDPGTLTDLPWAVELFGVRRHPVAIYEIIAVLGLLGAVVWLDSREAHQPGWLALVTLFGFAALRLFLDLFRVAGATVGDGWRVTQIGALAVVLLSGWLLGRMSMANRSSSQPADALPD